MTRAGSFDDGMVVNDLLYVVGWVQLRGQEGVHGGVAERQLSGIGIGTLSSQEGYQRRVDFKDSFKDSNNLITHWCNHNVYLDSSATQVRIRRCLETELWGRIGTQGVQKEVSGSKKADKCGRVGVDKIVEVGL